MVCSTDWILIMIRTSRQQDLPRTILVGASRSHRAQRHSLSHRRCRRHLAGALGAAGSFPSWADSEAERQSLYFVVDLLLMLGVFAAYAQNHEALGHLGTGGFLTKGSR